MHRHLAGLGLVLALGSCTPSTPLLSPPTPDTCEAGVATLFVGDHVLAMGEGPDPAAVLVRGDRIVDVGDPDQLANGHREPCLTRVELGERALLPGFIDSHAHVRELGMDAVKADLVGVTTAEDMIERLRTKYPSPDPGAWLIGQGWDEGAFASRGYPDRDILDQAFPDNPVFLESLHGFAGFANGRALEAARIGDDTPDPEGGTILRRESGAATGVLVTLAQGLVTAEIPPPSPAQLQRAIVAGATIMRAQGVTSVHEAGMGPADVAAFRALADEGRLPLRVYGMLSGNDEELMRAWFVRGPLEHPSGRLVVRGIKVFYDGSLGSRTAVLDAPYADHPEKARMTERISPARMASLAQRAVAHGFQMAVHAIGDGANRRTLEVFNQALSAQPGLDHRWRLEHAQVVDGAFFEDGKAMGVVASMQPSHAVGDSAWAEERLGKERIARAYAWRSMLDAGIPLALNSDLPGEPWTPVQTLYFAVTRQRLDGTPPGGWYPDQALTVEEALRAMTTTGAYAAFQEDELGRLAPGTRADLVLLDRDPREVPPAELKDLRVLETWIDGERVAGP